MREKATEEYGLDEWLKARPLSSSLRACRCSVSQLLQVRASGGGWQPHVARASSILLGIAIGRRLEQWTSALCSFALAGRCLVLG